MDGSFLASIAMGFKFTYRTGTAMVQSSKVGKEDGFGVHMCAEKKQYT